MLPIITVGLTQASLRAIERISGDRGCAHYATAEEALWDLPTGGDPTVSAITLDAAGERWRCHVIYGDDSIGDLLTHVHADPTPTRVPAAGLVAVVTDSLGDDQLAPRRVLEGAPEFRDVRRFAVEAVALLGAQAFLVVDQLDRTPNWEDAMVAALERAERDAVGRPVETLSSPGADAARALSLLAAQSARGLPRERGAGL